MQQPFNTPPLLISILLIVVGIALSTVDIIGATQWHHQAGYVVGGMGLGFAFLRCCLLIGFFFYPASYSPRSVKGYINLLAGLPGNLLKSQTSPTPPEMIPLARPIQAHDERLKQRRMGPCCSPYRVVCVLRAIIEFLLMVIVVMQIWARYGAAHDPDYKHWDDIHPCSRSSKNCVRRTLLQGLPPEKVVCLDAWIDATPRVRVLYRSYNDTGGNDYFAHIRILSKVFGFPDDVELNYLPSEMLVRVQSASRLGTSDLGVNTRRVNDMQDFVTNCMG